MTNALLIIGGGNMGAALASCWHDAFPDLAVTVAEKNAEKRAHLQAKGIDAPEELELPEDGYSIIVVAVKPQGFAELAPHLADIAGDATVISIMAGIPLATLKAAGLNHVARVMPNTPVVISEGMSAIYAPELAADRLEDVQTLFEAAGSIVMLEDEATMHAVTAISGSGPAYVYAFMEALEQAAATMGLDATLARALVRQTFVGATLLADASEADPAALRRQVTSPGGTTEAALKVLGDEGLNRLIEKAVHAAQTRSGALS